MSDTRILARAVRSMTLGSIDRHVRRANTSAWEGLNEIDQAFHIPVQGNAGSLLAWTDVELKFDAPLLDTPENRRTPYSDPTFTCGVVVSAPVIIMPNVALWHKTDEGTTTGALMRIGVYAPRNPADLTPEVGIPFKGEVHLNFQGYGAAEDDDDVGG